MTLRSSDLQSDSDLDSIRNSCDVFILCLALLILFVFVFGFTYFFVFAFVSEKDIFSSRFTQTAHQVIRKLTETRLSEDDAHEREVIWVFIILDSFIFTPRFLCCNWGRTQRSRLVDSSSLTEALSHPFLQPHSPTGSFSFNFKRCNCLLVLRNRGLGSTVSIV